MAGYKKSIKGDNNVASEIGAHNRIIIDTGGAGVIIFALFFIAAAVAVVVFLWIAYHALLVVMVLIVATGTVLFALILGGSYIVRHVSDTSAQVKVNQSHVEWSKIIYETESLVAHLDRRSQTVNIHNARDIQEVRHFNDKPVQAISEAASSRQAPPDNLDAFSQALNRNTHNGYN